MRWIFVFVCFGGVLVGCRSSVPQVEVTDEEAGLEEKEAGGDVEVLFREAKAAEHRGGVHWRADKETAKQCYARYLELMQQVVALDAENGRYGFDLALAHIKYAHACWFLGEGELEEHESAAEALLLADRRPDEGIWCEAFFALWVGFYERGDRAFLDDEMAVAAGDFAHLERLARVWLELAPDAPLPNEMMGVAQLKLAVLRLIEGQYDEADEALLGVEEMVRRGVHRGRIIAVEDLRMFMPVLRGEMDKLAGEVGVLERARGLQAMGLIALRLRERVPAFCLLQRAIALRASVVEEVGRSDRVASMRAHVMSGVAVSSMGQHGLALAGEQFVAAQGLLEGLLDEGEEMFLVSNQLHLLVNFGVLEEKRGREAEAERLFAEAWGAFKALERGRALGKRDLEMLAFLEKRKAGREISR